MPFSELVQLDHRGINLRQLISWQDGAGGPVDSDPLPGKVRVRLTSGDAWDLDGAAAERFRAAIREAAWTPDPPSLRRGVAAGSYDPETGEAVDPGAGGEPGPADQDLTARAQPE